MELRSLKAEESKTTRDGFVCNYSVNAALMDDEDVKQRE